MKRNILYIGMLLAALIVFSACDEAMESNLPAEYATVLYFQGSGEVDVDMTNLEEGEVTYRLIICKGGNQLGGTASARIEVMNQEQLSDYNDSYTLLPVECYSLESQLDFQTNDIYKQSEVLVKTSRIMSLIESDKEYVLPLQLTSEKCLVNPDNDQIFLKFNIK